MMGPFEGVIIQVISNGEYLDFYDDPDAVDVEIDCTRQHYVEAVTGASFAIKVILTSDFKLDGLRRKDAVEVAVEIDGQRTRWAFDFAKGDLEEMFLRREPGISNFTGATIFCQRTAQWMESDFSFGMLELSIQSTLLRV